MKTDKQWQAEGDASTLAESKVIEADTPRLKRAETAANQMAAEAVTRAKSLQSVSSKPAKPITKKAKKKTSDGPTTLDKYLSK